MRVVIQRVRNATCRVGERVVGSIGPGLVVLLGLETGDTWKEAGYCIRKILNAKLWDADPEDMQESRLTGERIKMFGGGAPAPPSKTSWALSVKDMNYEILVVSQFTLFGSVKKGNKPDFHRALATGNAQSFFDDIVKRIREEYMPDRIKTGQFGAFMQLMLTNDGPVTIIVEQRNEKAEAPSPDVSAEEVAETPKHHQIPPPPPTAKPKGGPASHGAKKAPLPPVTSLSPRSIAALAAAVQPAAPTRGGHTTRHPPTLSEGKQISKAVSHREPARVEEPEVAVGEIYGAPVKELDELDEQGETESEYAETEGATETATEYATESTGQTGTANSRASGSRASGSQVRSSTATSKEVESVWETEEEEGQ